MKAHIGAWDRFELWVVSKSLPVFPLSLEKVLKYALDLDARDCGPTVIPSLRSSLRWVTGRLAIQCLDLDDPQLLALQKEVVTKRAKSLKEAVPIPIEVVRCLEVFVASESPDQARLFIWWWLCLVYASLRFDDGVHVAPRELVLNDVGLFGVSWQTKVERKRRGTKFVIPLVGFSGFLWVQEGWDLLQATGLDRDFWISDLNSRTEFRAGPPDYTRSVQWLKVLARDALNSYGKGSKESIVLAAQQINKLSGHSARVTLLDAAVHAGRSTEEIGLQANWKNRFKVRAEQISRSGQDGPTAGARHACSSPSGC